MKNSNREMRQYSGEVILCLSVALLDHLLLYIVKHLAVAHELLDSNPQQFNCSLCCSMCENVYSYLYLRMFRNYFTLIK